MLLRCAAPLSQRRSRSGAVAPHAAPPAAPRRRSSLCRGASFDAWTPSDAAHAAASFAPFAASSEGAVAAMLSLAALQPGESVLDLGCGDGRVLHAALSWGAASVAGWELDAALCDAARDTLARATRGTAQTARVVCGDCRDADADTAAADVVMLFLLPEGLDALTPMLSEALPRGSGARRVVSHAFPLPAWGAADAVQRAPEGGAALYLYRR